MSLAAWTTLACVALCGVASGAEQAGVLSTLRRGHPRLMALEEDLERVKGLIASNSLARDYHEALRRAATRELKAPLLRYQLIGPRLLHVSRRALRRISTLAFLYRLDGDEPFARRAIEEMLNVCAFKDWHPRHFLDTAEMTHAVGIGYDWLYERLSPSQRKTIVEAIVQKGLLPAKKVYDGGGWWARSKHNWNQVCNGGITVGALAIADERPEIAAYIVEKSRASIARAMASYEPDGGWAEGPGYWNYATRYNVYYLAALRTALGTDFGLLKKFPGFSKAGDFRVYFCGPTGLTFNYADAHSRMGRSPAMFWLSRTFDKPLYAWHERNAPGGPSVHDLLWFDPRGAGPKADGIPPSKCFRGVEVVFLRSAWEDRNAVFVGFKGGNNRANHSHLDLGTFVLDALGQRWALDLGSDNYNLPSYFGSKRWTYYRLRTEGQNTLTIAGQNQDPRARAPIIAFGTKPGRDFAVADLSAAYRQARRWWRGIALVGGGSVVVQDEVELAPASAVAWTMHTRAAIETNGGEALLRQGDARLLVRILEPAGAKFEVASATPPKPQAQNEGVRRLMVRLAPTKVARIAIALVPFRGERPRVAIELEALKNWGKER